MHNFLREPRLCVRALVSVLNSHLSVSRAEIIRVHATEGNGLRLEYIHIFLRVTRMCQRALVSVLHSHLGVSRAEIIRVHAN